MCCCSTVSWFRILYYSLYSSTLLFLSLPVHLPNGSSFTARRKDWLSLNNSITQVTDSHLTSFTQWIVLKINHYEEGLCAACYGILYLAWCNKTSVCVINCSVTQGCVLCNLRTCWLFNTVKECCRFSDTGRFFLSFIFLFIATVWKDLILSDNSLPFLYRCRNRFTDSLAAGCRGHARGSTTTRLFRTRKYC